MTEYEEEKWSDLVERRCGIFFSPNRFYVLQNCLWTEMQLRGIEIYQDYYSLVLRNAIEWDCLVDRLVNRETSFFRHVPSFSTLVEEFLPARIAERSGLEVPPIRLWSAGCSSGQEAYSLAIAACEASWPNECQYEVLGTDLSAEALAVARRARYGERAISTMPVDLQRRYFVRRGSEYEVVPAIRSMVRFEQLNLLVPATYPTAAQDVIVCQNVFIYFREETRKQAAARLAACLAVGGILLPAPGELACLEISGLERVVFRHTVALRRNDAPRFHTQPVAKEPRASRRQ
jgi:chemotaxis methyl-accepting protein methylase